MRKPLGIVAYLTMGEACALCDANNGLIYYAGMRGSLALNVYDCEQYDGDLGERWSCSVEVLLLKLSALTQQQEDRLAACVARFWDKCGRLTRNDKALYAAGFRCPEFLEPECKRFTALHGLRFEPAESDDLRQLLFDDYQLREISGAVACGCGRCALMADAVAGIAVEEHRGWPYRNAVDVLGAVAAAIFQGRNSGISGGATKSLELKP